MLDANLQLTQFFPATGASVNTGTLDINVSQGGVPGFSDQWRLGRLRCFIPAIPGNLNANASATITLQDSADSGNSFQQTNPLIQVQIAGVANTGSAAQEIDMPLYPGLRGPIQLQLTTPANCNTVGVAALVVNWWNEE